nr:uncharacterized protein LOC124814411 [Hydra vulgaris]
MHSSTLISIIFSKSFCFPSSVPNSWKLANITPIYKKDQKTNPENYPISITSVLCKMMEQLVRDAMLKHLLLKNLLEENLYSFTSGKSCLTNLLESFDLITQALESRDDVVVVLLDFAKAFDKVSHLLLLKKVRAYGYDEYICQSVNALLSNRKKRVIIENSESNWLSVLSGVPQETKSECDLGVVVHNRYLWNDQSAKAISNSYTVLGILRLTFKQ